MRKLLMVAALMTGMATLSQSTAQDFDPALFKLIGPVTRTISSNPAMMLRMPGVQKELKLDEDQIKAIGESKAFSMGLGGGGFGKGGKGGFDEAAKERMSKMFEKVGKLKDVPEDQLDEKIRELFKEELEGPTKEAEKILKPEQMARLKQIGLQQAGLRGLIAGDAAKELKLTDEQAKKIKDINAELDKDVAELTRAAGGGGMGGFGRMSAETREKMMGLRKEAFEKAQDVLTADQKSKWKSMTGEPFEMKFEPRRPKKDD